MSGTTCVFPSQKEQQCNKKEYSRDTRTTSSWRENFILNKGACLGFQSTRRPVRVRFGTLELCQGQGQGTGAELYLKYMKICHGVGRVLEQNFILNKGACLGFQSTWRPVRVGALRENVVSWVIGSASSLWFSPFPCSSLHMKTCQGWEPSARTV